MANKNFHVRHGLTVSGSASISGILTVSGNTVWHAGNDGAGSGLDADTLDGVQGSSFLRSDAADTASGNINFTSTTTPITTNAIQFNNTENDGNYYTDASGVLAFDENFNADTLYGSGTYDPDTVFTGGDGGGLLIKNQDGWGAIFTTQNTRWASVEWANLKIGSNQVWHAGNDGASSGLDADTVDGIDSGSFLRSDANDSFTGALTGSGTISVTGQIIECGRTSGSVAMTTNDGYGNANLCFNHTSGVPDVSGSSCRIETAVDTTTGSMVFKIGNSVTSGAATALTETLRLTTSTIQYGGNTVWHAGNDGSGSGLDADTVDGVQLSRIVYDKQSTIGTGSSWDITSPGIDGVASGSAFTGTNAPSGVYTYGHLLTTERDGHGIAQIYFPHTGSSSSKLVFRTGWNNASWQGWSTIWSSNCDGAGSGLHADLLDGQQGSYYLDTSSTAQTKSGDLRLGGSSYNIAIGMNNISASGTVGHTATYDEGIFWHTDNTYAIYRTAGSWTGPDYQQLELNWPTGIRLDGGTLFGQSGVKVIGDNNSLTVNGNVAWNAGNDGSGSGLDADTLDGVNSTSFLRSDASDQYDGQTAGRVMRFRCVDGRNAGSSTGSLFPLEIYQNSNVSNSDAAMTFHISGRFATYFGLNRETNDLFTGGWSDGSTKHKIWHAGNDGAGSGLDADLLDGISSASFLRGDVDDTFTRLTGTRISLGYNHGVDNSIGCSNWFRSSGNSGWYNGTYGGGWYMVDSTWIRSYNNKSIYQNAGVLRTDGTLQVGNNGGTLNAPNGGAVIIPYLRAQSTSNPGGGNSTTGYAMQVQGIGYFSHANSTPLYVNRNTAGGGILSFRYQGSEKGEVIINTGSVSYTSASDYRLKENVVALENGIERVKQLKPYRFNFIENPDETVDGFFAHEAQEVVHECASGTKDKMQDIGTLTEWDGTVIETDSPQPEELTWEETTTDEDGNETTQTRTRTWEKTGEKPVYQGIDQAKLVPLLTAALQEAIAKIETLETKVAALEAGN